MLGVAQPVIGVHVFVLEADMSEAGVVMLSPQQQFSVQFDFEAASYSLEESPLIY